MDIYSKKSRWKLYLAFAGIVIVLTSLLYTNRLTSRLAEEERKKMEIYFFAQEQFNLGVMDFQLHEKVFSSNTTIPALIVVDDQVVEGGYINFPNDDMNYLNRQLSRMKSSGPPPIVNEEIGQKVYYKESNLLKQLRLYPIIQLFLIAAFILFGYMGFSSARRAEQNRVWVGMAKETAHQLGTPISAIVAWLEHLRMIKEGDNEVLEVVDELENDVSRLELIADRFSKIGSEPELKPTNVYEALDHCRAYMQRRAPRKVNFDFPGTAPAPLTVYINTHLFNWVVENLLRNALDAMGGKGEISSIVYEEGDFICIDIHDTGKGIPPSKFKTVFQPGYTTKKRGWGLGLSLAKRIIQEYHSGKIFVKDSTEGEGTTFTIKLPKKNPKKSLPQSSRKEVEMV
jgi:anti-sigma regulatory factor (Ser/Thr protein kinase)